MQVRAFSAPACLRVRGLPFTATQEDLLSFFEGFKMAESGNPIEIIAEDQVKRSIFQAKLFQNTNH